MTAGFPLGDIRVYSPSTAENYHLRPARDLARSGHVLVHQRARRRRSTPKPAPVAVTRVNDGVRRHALELVGGDARLIKILDKTHIQIADTRYPGGPRFPR